ncbi:hypothetical protein PT974_03879 [Cladobotryum mycophilum]|uniref:Uncharacterized protein n=1 Tax=Cladobotryum mycophilum TaxID=491253 RepID=A0ABR0STJ4_9HYPO
MSYSAYIAVYEDADVRYPDHWALQLLNNNDADDSIMFQVLLSDNMVTYFVDEPAYRKPEDAKSFSEKLHVGDVKTDDINKLIALIERVPMVQYARHRWNCQSWVMDVLDEMCKRDLLTWKDRMRTRAQKRMWFLKA